MYRAVGILWFLMECFGTLWKFEISWKLLNPFGFVWIFLELFGRPRTWVEESFGIFWNIFEFLEILWNLEVSIVLEQLESFWNPLEPFWNPLDSFSWPNTWPIRIFQNPLVSLGLEQLEPFGIFWIFHSCSAVLWISGARECLNPCCKLPFVIWNHKLYNLFTHLEKNAAHHNPLFYSMWWSMFDSSPATSRNFLVFVIKQSNPLLKILYS